MALNWPPPQGYPAASAAAPTVNVAASTGLIPSSLATFVLVGGTSTASQALTVPVPPGAASIVSVYAAPYWDGDSNEPACFASASGYADGSSAAALAARVSYAAFESGGALALGIDGIVLPGGLAGVAQNVVVTYTTS